MLFRCHTPRPPLSEFVDTVWYFECGQPSHTAEKVLPNGCMQFIINLGSGCDNNPIICGARSEAVTIDPQRLTSVIGVSFRPGGALPFLNTSAGDLLNSAAPLDSLWGNAAAELRDRLLEADTVDARVRLVETYLMARFSPPRIHSATVTHAVERFRNVARAMSVRDVVSETGYSQARFIQIFRDAVGVTPKVFSRIQRFQAVIRQVFHEPDVDWARVAADCGYFDQAHFSHDFRAFAGMTPTAYLAARSQFQNHVLLGD